MTIDETMITFLILTTAIPTLILFVCLAWIIWKLRVIERHMPRM